MFAALTGGGGWSGYSLCRRVMRTFPSRTYDNEESKQERDGTNPFDQREPNVKVSDI